MTASSGAVQFDVRQASGADGDGDGAAAEIARTECRAGGDVLGLDDRVLGGGRGEVDHCQHHQGRAHQQRVGRAVLAHQVPALVDLDRQRPSAHAAQHAAHDRCGQPLGVVDDGCVEHAGQQDEGLDRGETGRHGQAPQLHDVAPRLRRDRPQADHGEDHRRHVRQAERGDHQRAVHAVNFIAPQPPPSIVELRRVLLALALRQVVVDPERRLLLRHQVGDLLVRSLRLLGAGVHGGDPLVVPIVLEVGGIARQHQPAGLGQMHKQ